ncbi:Fc.00g070780.m01.CDS01 [Cosmosporella sp. VM-42]
MDSDRAGQRPPPTPRLRSANADDPAQRPDETQQPPEAPRPDGLRRCFICLTDEDPSDPPSSWVNPCPCTLEAHQDCMLAWVTDCERSNKQLLCPVCKSPIELEGTWDPVVALTENISRKFTRASPFILATSVTLGVQFSLQMYGALAMWTFAGKDALMQFIVGPNPTMIVNGRSVAGWLPAKESFGNALVLTNVAPALLMGQLMPWLGNKIFLPTAGLYGMYHFIHEDDFLNWPPSPQLAMAMFPYIRSAYFNLWREFVFPYEVNFNRKIMGLPPLEPRQNDQVNHRRDANRNGEGGIMGFLQGLLDALDPDDEHEHDHDHNHAHGMQVVDDDGGVVMELVIEEIHDGEEGDDDDEWEDEDNDRAPLMDVPDPQFELPRDQQERNRPAEQPEQDAPADRPLDQPADQPADEHNHEVPQAPPARRPSLSSILSSISNSIVTALILPGISFVMGELIRLALPRAWTSPSANYPWSWHRRPGLLQQQWGRSLVGGCLYVVMKDAVRFYTKYRKVAAMDHRKVKNVDRKRDRR